MIKKCDEEYCSGTDNPGAIILKEIPIVIVGIILTNDSRLAITNDS